MKPAVLDGGHLIVLANLPDNNHVICNDNNYIPIKKFQPIHMFD